jgi:hypothetical protein
MRTTLELPDALVEEAMTLTKIQTKKDEKKIQGLKKYYGKVDLVIDVDTLRKRI